MIDTIKISIDRELNKSLYDTLLYNSEQRTSGFMVNSMSGITERQELWRMRATQYENHEMLIINGKMHVPSYNYHIHYRAFEDRIEMEFSLPKFIYGVNVLELRCHLFKNKYDPHDMLVRSLKKFFDYFFFGHKIEWGGIALMRWDFCYNQVFRTREDALKVLEYIKIKYSKKTDTKNYEFGYIELSKSKYFKIYHKGEEFRKNDAHKITKYRDQFEAMADCTLRYEKKCTPKNIAYWYNVSVKHAGQPLIVKEYMKQKTAGKVSREMRADFENVQKFTLGRSKLVGHTKMTSEVFNHLYTMFRDDIRKKYNVGKMSLDKLSHEVLNENDKKNKTMKIRILALIKSFGSLEKAHEKKAISPSTLRRYKLFMAEKNLSTTKIPLNIEQDWKHLNYYSAIAKNCIVVNNLTKDLDF